MRYASLDMREHLQQSVTTLCLCFRVTREDGQAFRFTGHDRDILIVDDEESSGLGGELYRSDIGFSASEADSKYGLSVDNSELTLPLVSGGITKADVLARLFWKAELDVFWVNWADTSMGMVFEAKGWLLGKATLKDYQVVFEVRSLASYLDAGIIDVVTPYCPYTFGVNDGFRSKCPVNINSYKVSGTVTSVVEGYEKLYFYGTAYGSQYSYGKITFTSGNNSGYSIEVYSGSGPIILFLDMPYEIEVGDSYDMWTGCSKWLPTCQSYGAALSYGGEPYVPSKDTALQYEVD